MGVPVIETERLILRAHRLEDFPALAAMWGDSAVSRFVGGKPATREECWARLLRYAGHWQLLAQVPWSIFNRHRWSLLDRRQQASAMAWSTGRLNATIPREIARKTPFKV